ncbi:TIGR02206 family membrane protein [Paenibacillus lentus]|uniref:TIGR02206 family membrane protein n=2 Tax=Paenibacillus lentus TaxID=1338368 RepID=A0A3Q8S4J5_9BACL|nr:TIGR02206 family membrane protein [Paenibacillus lentus]AZK46309.1 TIGR02206 family membrane protein [Paenibacillus lentus]
MDMSSFFRVKDAPDFVMYSTSHLVGMGLLLLLIAVLFAGRRYIGSSVLAMKVIRYGLLGLLLLSEIALNSWYVFEGQWDITDTLPLELCSVSLLLSIVMLLTRNRLLYQILFFAGIGGALQAWLTPSLDFGYPHFRFFHFFIAHGAIILASLYMTWIEHYRPTWKSIAWAMLFLNVLALAVGALNYAIGANYMFLRNKPSTPSILDMFGPHPYYLLAEELIALTMFIVMYALFFWIPDLRRRVTRQSEKERELTG